MADDYHEIIKGIREGNTSAFKELYLKFHKKIYGFCINNGQSHPDAEEVLQEVFLKIWARRHKLDPDNVQSYIFSIAKNIIVDKYRKLVKMRAASEYQILFMEPENGTENTVIYNELKEEIQKTFDAMPEMRKLIFQMSRFKGYSNKEIAAELGISIRTVENHIAKAIQNFRSDLGQSSAVLAFLVVAYLV